MDDEAISLFKKYGTILFFIITSIVANAQSKPACSSFIDPFIGSEGLGNVFVGPSCPFGMVKPGPDVNKASNSGYSPDQDIPLYGFSQVHVSGTGGGPKYGNILLMPFAGDLDNIRQESLRENEKVSAGYYSVLLKQHRIKTEITCTPKVAFYRFAYSTSMYKALKIDAGEFLGEKPIPDYREAQQFVGSEVEVVSNTEVRGYSRIRGGWNNGSAYTVYFYAISDKPFTFSTYKNGKLYPGVKFQVDEGGKTGALLYFDDATAQQVQVKIGISFISTLKARQNIAGFFGPCLNHYCKNIIGCCFKS